MSRSKVTAYVPPALRDAVRRAAIIEDRSISDFVEDALARYFDGAHRDAEHHAVIAKLQRLSQRMVALEKGLETQFELICHATLFTMSVSPEIPADDWSALNARGSQRFNKVIAAIVARLSKGRGVWRESFAASEQTTTRSTDDRDSHANVSDAATGESDSSSHSAGPQSAE